MLPFCHVQNMLPRHVWVCKGLDQNVIVASPYLVFMQTIYAQKEKKHGYCKVTYINTADRVQKLEFLEQNLLLHKNNSVIVVFLQQLDLLAI